MPNNELLELEIPQFEKVKSGKVREVFDMGESYLFVASDRVSAFDVVLPNGIPRKGEVLTQISHFWFDRFENDIPNHRIKDGLPEESWRSRCSHRAPRLTKAMTKIFRSKKPWISWDRKPPRKCAT